MVTCSAETFCYVHWNTQNSLRLPESAFEALQLWCTPQPRTEDEQAATNQARYTAHFYGNTRAFSTSSLDELFCCVSRPHASTLCPWTELRSYGSAGQDGRNFPFSIKELLRINNALSIMSEKHDVLFRRESMVGKYFIIELQTCGRMDTWNGPI